MLGLGGSFLERATKRRADRLRRERLERGGIVANFVRDVGDVDFEAADDAIVVARPMIDMERYRELLGVLPDKIVSNLERARLERAGIGTMLKAGLGYEEVLSSIIVDATAVGTSSAEAKLVPVLVFPPNFLQPGGIPGRTLRTQARGRVTTLATSATLTTRQRLALTDVITTNIHAQTGAVTSDAAAQTNSQWEYNSTTVVRSVGSAGTIFTQGRMESATQALTVAARTASFAGSAGAAAPATLAIDMGVSLFWQITAQWSLATAYSIQTHQYIVEALN